MNHQTTLSKIYKMIEQLTSELKRKPLPEEIAIMLDIEIDYLRFIGDNINWEAK